MKDSYSIENIIDQSVEIKLIKAGIVRQGKLSDFSVLKNESLLYQVDRERELHYDSNDFVFKIKSLISK